MPLKNSLRINLYDIHTFMGQSSVNLKEVTMEIYFNNNYKLPLPLLVTDKLYLHLHMPDLEIAIHDIKNN